MNSRLLYKIGDRLWIEKLESLHIGTEPAAYALFQLGHGRGCGALSDLRVQSHDIFAIRDRCPRIIISNTDSQNCLFPSLYNPFGHRTSLHTS